MIEQNGVIMATMLGFEDHGIMTAWITCDFGGSGQGFGGFGMDGPIKDADGKHLRREGVAWGMEFLRRVLETLEVREWEQLKGKPIRIRRDEDYGKIIAIGHFHKDRWFNPDTDIAHLRRTL